MEDKILIISEIFYPEIGSGATRITNMVLDLKSKGYKVDVLTSEPKYPNKELYKDEKFWDKDKEEVLQKNSNIYRICPSKINVTENFSSRLYIYMYSLVKSSFVILFLKGKYDVVIATTPSVFMGLLGIVAKIKFKSKFILDIRDLWPECLKNISIFKRSRLLLKLGYLLEGFIFKFTDSLIINSKGFRPYLIEKGYKKEIVFIPNGLSEQDREKNEEIIQKVDKHKKFTVIYSGMIGLPQNVRVIVKAANYLRNHIDIDFKIIGTGIQKGKVIELIKHYGLKNIEVEDPMPKEEALEEVAKAHIAIAHLRGDSAFDIVIPGKIIDYMGIGLPIVAGVEGYTAEVVNESKAGIVVKPDDYIAMGKAIEKIYNDTEIRQALSNNGIEYSNKEFNWNRNILKVENLIKKTLRS